MKKKQIAKILCFCFAISDLTSGKVTIGDSLWRISKSKKNVIVSKTKKGEFKVPVNQRMKDQRAKFISERNTFRSVRKDAYSVMVKWPLLRKSFPSMFREHSTGMMAAHRVFCGANLWQKYSIETHTVTISTLEFQIAIVKDLKSSVSNQRKLTFCKWEDSKQNMKCQHTSIYYKYNVIDIHSRYFMPQFLKSKASSEVATVLEKAMLDHGSWISGQGDEVVTWKISHQNHTGRPLYPQL